MESNYYEISITGARAAGIGQTSDLVERNHFHELVDRETVMIPQPIALRSTILKKRQNEDDDDRDGD
jgi:hypothetical protein